MTDRQDLARTFLAGTAWARANRATLAGDASNRRYERLTDPATGGTAVLMDAPPDRGEDVRPFIRIAEHLRQLGLSAPEILASDVETGFLLLEDLGDDLFARVIPQDPTLERPLYEAATDVLVDLHQAALPEVETYTPQVMADLSALAYEQYVSGITGADTSQNAERFTERFHDILTACIKDDPVLILRDYHAENLIWLPARSGTARVGLLDFQDAMAGHRAYDLVSLLQDIRRDVPVGIENLMLSRYIARAGVDEHTFRTAYAVLGAQRNLRILGVFARLGRAYGKPHYVDMIPKVWTKLMLDLEHPALATVAEMLIADLPVPTPENLTRLKPG